MTPELLPLHDGRSLSFWEFGDHSGTPVVYCHGFPGSGCEAELAQEAAVAGKVRLIAPDRPGYGRSTYQAGRCLNDWPADMVALANHLHLDRFLVLGLSGGAPYALACAASLSTRVRAAAVVGGLGPLACGAGLAAMHRLSRTGLGLVRRWPDTLPALLNRIPRRAMRRLPHLLLPFLMTRVSGPDREVLRQARAWDVLSRAVHNAVVQGPQGTVHDLRLYASDWGFSVRTITAPLHIWHGLEDVTVPPQFSEWLAAQLPSAQSTLLEGEGHYSLPVRHFAKILEALCRA